MVRKVSVIIPTLNEEKYLPDCLRLLSRQHADFDVEIIIADGNSKDRTRDIARKSGAKVVVEKKHTIAAGRQAGAKIASGDILVFTDADARPADSKWLSRLCHAFDDEKVVAAYGSLSIYDSKRAGAYALFITTYFYWASVMKVAAGAGSNMAVRTKDFWKVGGFDVDLVTGEDIQLQQKLKRRGKLVYKSRARTCVSARRIQNWGLARFLGFHVTNFVKLQMGRTGHKKYEPIR
ncbi:MAG: glycosyltransferase [Candidatus Micrarchaeia archaeon]